MSRPGTHDILTHSPRSRYGHTNSCSWDKIFYISAAIFALFGVTFFLLAAQKHRGVGYLQTSAALLAGQVIVTSPDPAKSGQLLTNSTPEERQRLIAAPRTDDVA